MARSSAAEAFAHRLKALIEREGYSIRGFGKKVDEEDPERGRRRVQRHLSGKHLPSKASRDSYAKTLDVPASELPLPDDENGADVESALNAIERDHRSMGQRITRLRKVVSA